MAQRSDYIPHELVTFTEDEITHSVSVTVRFRFHNAARRVCKIWSCLGLHSRVRSANAVQVAAPLPAVFAFWKERTGYVKWFDLIHQASNPFVTLCFVCCTCGIGLAPGSPHAKLHHAHVAQAKMR